MTDLIVVPQSTQWQRLKALVLDGVSSPITKRVYNLGLDEFFEWFGREPRPGFAKATVSAWRVALEARGLGSVSINVRITAVRKLAAEAADNGLLAPSAQREPGVARLRWLSLLSSFHLEASRRPARGTLLWTKSFCRSTAQAPAKARAAPARQPRTTPSHSVRRSAKMRLSHGVSSIVASLSSIQCVRHPPSSKSLIS